MSITREKALIRVLGGCIENQRPSDKSDGCECFQITFVVSHNLKVQRITICREWARYMAGHRAAVEQRRVDTAWCDVVRELVIAEFECKHYCRTSWHYNIHSATLRDLIKPLGYFPAYFVETVMDNRYGCVTNAIPLRDMAERYFSEDIETSIGAGRYAHEWGYTASKWDHETIERNSSELRNFNLVLDRIASHSKAIASMKDHVKKRGTRAEDFAAVLLHVASTEALKKPKQPTQ
jgi:hypothetical protein